MDTKHRKIYATLKQTGVAQPIRFDEGMALVQLLPAIGREIAGLPSRYSDLHIHMSFQPITEQKTEQEKHLAEVYAGLDLSQMEYADDDGGDDIWAQSPMNPKSEAYDPLYHEYQNCYRSPHRLIKTPEDLAILRRHVESKYEGTRWWDGSHKW